MGQVNLLCLPFVLVQEWSLHFDLGLQCCVLCLNPQLMQLFGNFVLRMANLSSLVLTCLHSQKRWLVLPQNKHLGISITEFDSFDLEWLTLNVDTSFEHGFDTFDCELLLDDELEEPLIFNLIMTLSNLFKISEIGG